MYLLFNLFLTALITIVIGNMVRIRSFPFGGHYRSFWDFVNLVFIVINIWSIVMTIIGLGIMTPYGIAYTIFIILMFLCGWLMDEVRLCGSEWKAYGFGFAIRSFADRALRALGLRK